MPSLPIVIVMTLAFLLGLIAVTFMVYVFLRYSAIVARIFEERPLFLPLRVPRVEDGEAVNFVNQDGLNLVGTYLKSRSEHRAGVIIFCHEYLGNRWSVLPYLDHLRSRGFDLLTFDFRNHGDSSLDPGYKPLQWVTEHEIQDLQAAIDYLKSRPDADPAGVGLFGVSRGGGTAVCVAARERSVWGVITDGAFPTRGTMISYIRRWAEIYVQSKWFWRIAPTFLFDYLAWTGRIRTQFRMRCRYSNVEKAVARLAPRPWLVIHGQKDAYINVAIVEELFSRAHQPKEIWIVPQAKHNRSREKEPQAYASRLIQFLDQYAPRRLASIEPTVGKPPVIENIFLDASIASDPLRLQPVVEVPLSS